MVDKEYHKQYRKEYKKKVKYLNVSIPMKTYLKMKQLAEKEDVKVSALFRNMAIAYMEQKTFVPNEVQDELKKLRLLMRNVSNNVNQVAHHSNIIHGLIHENNFLDEIKKLETMVTDYTLKRLKNYNDY